MSNLAIIPARGGSKRIPRKNIRDFLGKPIIAYSIQAALESNLFEEVMVSTDDIEIADIAMQYGASVPFMRSAQNSDDFSTTVDVLNEVHEMYKTNTMKSFDFACCIYPTAPLIQVKHLRDGFGKLLNGNFTSVFPVVQFGYPIWRGLAFENNDSVKMVWPKYINSRSQDLQKVYHDAGQWYWYRPSIIDESIFTDNSSSLILDEQDVQDIDSQSDWIIAEIKYKLQQERKS